MNQQVGHIFHAAAIAELANVIARAGDAVEHGLASVEGVLIARSIDREVAVNRLGPSAGDRAIEQYGAAAGQVAAGPGLDLDRQGAGLDDDQAVLVGRHQRVGAVDHLLERRLRGQGCDDHLGILDRRLGRFCAAAAKLYQGFDIGLDDVETGNLQTGIDKIFGKRAPHNAEADNADV